MELLAVMLLILTVLGMGVPAMFAAERKSYVNQAQQALIEIHNKCMKLQLLLAAKGDGGVVTLTINGATNKPEVQVRVSGTTNFTPNEVDQWFGRKITGSPITSVVSINSDEFISAVDTVNATTGTTIPPTWSYVPQVGFINSTDPIKLTFKALPFGSPVKYKVNRELTLYPQGYSEVP